jgi:hypothetical protein
VTVEDVVVVSSWTGGMKQQGEGQTLVKDISASAQLP